MQMGTDVRDAWMLETQVCARSPAQLLAVNHAHATYRLQVSAFSSLKDVQGSD